MWACFKYCLWSFIQWYEFGTLTPRSCCKLCLVSASSARDYLRTVYSSYQSPSWQLCSDQWPSFDPSKLSLWCCFCASLMPASKFLLAPTFSSCRSSYLSSIESRALCVSWPPRHALTSCALCLDSLFLGAVTCSRGIAWISPATYPSLSEYGWARPAGSSTLPSLPGLSQYALGFSRATLIGIGCSSSS